MSVFVFKKKYNICKFRGKSFVVFRRILQILSKNHNVKETVSKAYLIRKK